MKNSVELIAALQYNLRIFGVPIDRSTDILSLAVPYNWGSITKYKYPCHVSSSGIVPCMVSFHKTVGIHRFNSWFCHIQRYRFASVGLKYPKANFWNLSSDIIDFLVSKYSLRLCTCLIYPNTLYTAFRCPTRGNTSLEDSKDTSRSMSALPISTDKRRMPINS